MAQEVEFQQALQEDQVRAFCVESPLCDGVCASALPAWCSTLFANISELALAAFVLISSIWVDLGS